MTIKKVSMTQNKRSNDENKLKRTKDKRTKEANDYGEKEINHSHNLYRKKK